MVAVVGENREHAPSCEPVGSLAALIPSFRRTLRSEDKRPHTIDRYVAAATRLDAYLAAKGMPRQVASVRREHVESFMEDMVTRFKPATASVRYSRTPIISARRDLRP